MTVQIVQPLHDWRVIISCHPTSVGWLKEQIEQRIPLVTEVNPVVGLANLEVRIHPASAGVVQGLVADIYGFRSEDHQMLPPIYYALA